MVTEQNVLLKLWMTRKIHKKADQFTGHQFPILTHVLKADIMPNSFPKQYTEKHLTSNKLQYSSVYIKVAKEKPACIFGSQGGQSRNFPQMKKFKTTVQPSNLTSKHRLKESRLGLWTYKAGSSWQ